ncbi:unnamed protein product [Danaus chrysippus]|uniref:(African queen) hypothetical protein n=1 Tax=Danaus chrysippus TaxID=151541 RepID=A0A8J2R3L9_9NEOP|nr:unnamed protein product [Danaus chrysippus]
MFIYNWRAKNELVSVGISFGRPRLFLNGVYTNTNKHQQYQMSPYNIVPGIRFVKVKEKQTGDFDECYGKVDESREACLRHKNPDINRFQPDSDSGEDLDRSFHGYNNFSHDYVDINDLLRTNKLVQKKDKNKKSYIFKVLKPNKFDRFTYDLTKFRRDNRKRKYKSEDSDSSDETEESSLENVNQGRIAKNKRFQIAEKSNSDSSDSSEEIKQRKRKKKSKIPSDGMMYMQSPSRLYELRRRLPNFFPKRYHWDENDMKDLRNYWFSGPQGKYWGQYKTPYS